MLVPRDAVSLTQKKTDRRRHPRASLPFVQNHKQPKRVRPYPEATLLLGVYIYYMLVH